MANQQDTREDTSQPTQEASGKKDIGIERDQRPSFFASPLSAMRRFAEDIDRSFSDAARGRDLSPLYGAFGGAMWTPQVDVFERDGDLIVRADLPGMRRDQIKVEVENGSLLIEGERRFEHEENRAGLYRSERQYGVFRRAIALPEGVDVEHANASFEDGVLEIRMKGPTERQRQRHKVEIGGGRTPEGGAARH